MSADQPESYEARLAWIGVDELPIYFTNQFYGQAFQDEITLNFGQMTPPPLFGSREEHRALAEQITFVPVKPVTRVSLTPARLEELIKVLTDTLEIHRKQAEAQ